MGDRPDRSPVFGPRSPHRLNLNLKLNLLLYLNLNLNLDLFREIDRCSALLR